MMMARRPQQRPSGQRFVSSPPDTSQDEKRYPIPAASAEAWRAIESKDVPVNPGLVFDRFVQDWGWREQQFQGKEVRKKAWQEIVKIAPRADCELLERWQDRWKVLVREAGAEPFLLKTDWRFAAGLGRKGPLEAGFTFHRYGFPILPGSSVKGVARAWALIQIAVELGTSELRNLDEILSADGAKDDKERKHYEAWRARQSEAVQELAEAFRAIFGTTAAAGQAVFFDAIPAARPTLKLDVMNPHYPQYYTGDQFPTDWQSPVPVYFLAVAPETPFLFAVGWRGPLDAEGQRLRGLAEEWLRKGLMHLGAGAKTSAGYGYFSPVEEKPAEPPKPPEAQVSLPAKQPAPVAPEMPLTWRTGTVREYQPDKGRGRLVDDETGEELSFQREAIEEKGWSPGKKAKVQFAMVMVEIEGKKIVKLRKPRTAAGGP